MVQFEQQQLDMKNQTDPFSRISQFSIPLAVTNQKVKVELELQPNEFTDHTDPIGFFEQEYDPIEFLTLANK